MPQLRPNAAKYIHTYIHTHIHTYIHKIIWGRRAILKSFLKFIYFNWRLISLQYCGGFCHTLTWISHRCTCPLSQTPIPSLCAVPVHLSHASNLDWSSISHTVINMFQCYSLKSSCPHLLSQSSKVCSLYLCLFCCLVHRVVITTFLNSIYTR